MNDKIVRRSRAYFIYILANRRHTVLYVGRTNSLARRLSEHRSGLFKESFTRRYNVTDLVYYEEYDSWAAAAARERQLKAGSRAKKVACIESVNPVWQDLSGQL